jgi:transcriptional regulator with XRE-family HTH domain
MYPESVKNLKEKDTQALADRIRALRDQMGWTQAELAEKSGLTDGAIKMLETARRWPQPKTVRLIADAFGVEPWQLFVTLPSSKKVGNASDATVGVENSATGARQDNHGGDSAQSFGLLKDLGASGADDKTEIVNTDKLKHLPKLFHNLASEVAAKVVTALRSELINPDAALLFAAFEKSESGIQNEVLTLLGFETADTSSALSRLPRYAKGKGPEDV